MAADTHTTHRKHHHQPKTQRPGWGADPPHRHFTHAQPLPPANEARAQAPKAGPGGSDSAPPNGWAALFKRLGGYPNLAPTEGVALPG